MMNGLNGAVRRYQSLDDLIDHFEGQIEPLLEFEDVIDKIQNNNIKIHDFLQKEASLIISRKFVDLLSQEYNKECIENNYNQYVLYPQNVIEILELNVPVLTDELITSEQLIIKLFRIINQEYVPEPQFSYLNRLTNILMQKGASTVSKMLLLHFKEGEKPLIRSFLHHMQSQSIANIIIQLFNPENQKNLVNKEEIMKVKLDFLTEMILLFDKLEPLAIINATQIISEIMTRHSAEYSLLVEYLTNVEVANKMFDILEFTSNNYEKKNAAHILFLITDYQVMKNPSMIEPSEEEVGSKNQVETSQFMEVFSKRLYIIVDLLKIRKLSALNLKLIEIIENLMKIQSIQLWKRTQELRALEQLIYMFFNFPLANIMHNQIDRIFSYILTRTVQNHNPFFAQLMIIESKLFEMLNLKLTKQSKYGPYLQLANNLNWFQKEITEKMILQKEKMRYLADISKIVYHFENNIDWIDCQLALINLNKRNRIELGSGLTKYATSTPMHTIQKYHDNNQQQSSSPEKFIQENSQPSETKEQVAQISEITAIPEQDPIESSSTFKSPPNSQSIINNNEEVDEAPQELKIVFFPESMQTKDYKFESMSPYSKKKNNHKITNDDDQDEDSSIQLKQNGVDDPVPNKFQVIRRRHSLNQDEKLIIQPQNMKILKVDEIDMNDNANKLNDSISSSNSRGSLVRFQVEIKEDVKVLNYEEDQQITVQDSFTSRSMGETFSQDEKKFRKVQEKDKRFLDFLKSIK